MNNLYVGLIIEGKNPNLYIKRLINNNISFDNMKLINHNKIFIKVRYLDYINFKSVNSIYNIYVIKYYGILKIINFIKNNMIFIISFFISFIFLIFISNICFDIKIDHNNIKLRKLIYSELNDYNIKKLRLIPNFKDRKKIVNKIIRDNKDKIEWMEIERKGVKLIIKVTERKINPTKKLLNSRHIIAKKSGIIKKIEAINGMILKKENDYVSKGDIIVSGDIIKDDEVKKQVVANGHVFAEVWYTAKVSYPLYYSEIKYLEDVKNNYVVKYFDKDFYLKKGYDKSYLENKFIIISNKLFPFNIGIEKQRKIKIKKQKLSNKKAIQKAINLAESKINAKLSKEEYIISKKALNFNDYNSKIEIEVFFKVCEDITDYKDTEDFIEEIN